MIEKEKYLENKLVNKIKNIDGLCIKLLPTFLTGLPDRLCLFQGGKICFAEIKETGKKLKPVQVVWKNILEKMGFRFYIVDQSAIIDIIIEEHKC